MSFITFPSEIFELILTVLDLNSVKALRLVDRKLARSCLGPRFLGCIQQPNFDVTLDSLRSLHALACNPVLRKKIHSLTLVATNLDSTELDRNVKSGTYTVTKYHGRWCKTSQKKYSRNQLPNAKSDLAWLQEQQKARAGEQSSELIETLRLALKEFGKLDSIHLDGACVAGRVNRKEASSGPWYPLFIRASQIFYLAITAIVQSGISITKFDAYRNTPRCCIPSRDITIYTSALSPQDLGIMTKELESLELSMSGEIRNPLDVTTEDEETDKEGEEVSGEQSGYAKETLSQNDFPAALGITSIIKSATALRELNLSFRRTMQVGKFERYDRIIEAIAHETQFPMLEKCAFYGLPAKEESIRLFLRKHPNLRSFTLHECSLTTGSWTPIFSHLEQSMPKLERLSLSDLFGKHMHDPKHLRRRNDPNPTDEEVREVDGHVNLQPIWDAGFSPREKAFSTFGGALMHTRAFDREEIQKGLVFWALGPGRALGSPELMNWRHTRKALYGPP